MRLKPDNPGEIESERRPGRSDHKGRQAEDKRGSHERSRRLCAGPVLTTPSPKAKSDAEDDSRHDRSQKPERRSSARQASASIGRDC